MSAPLTIGAHAIRRENSGDRAREMWCLTDLWRASGAPRAHRPVDYLRTAECRTFAEFIAASADVLISHVTKTRRIAGGGGETWTHWQLALAYAKWISPEFHARVNEVYRAYTEGTLRQSEAERELIRLNLRMAPAPTKSPWSIIIKEHLARLYGLAWVPGEREPLELRSAYGFVWRWILGDAVYEELKRRNPYPRSNSLHAEWLENARIERARIDDFVRVEMCARYAHSWAEFRRRMLETFERAPAQLPMTFRAPKRLRKGGSPSSSP